MNRLESISPIEKQFTTNGSAPILVLTNDYNLYVCKYNRTTSSFSGQLVNEYLASSFLTLWNLNTPKISCVAIKNEHVINLPPAWFNLPCFGSLYNKYFKEIDSFTKHISHNEQKGIKQDNLFLKICLFDIWLANEDRHPSNFNLLIDTTNNNRLVAIDHTHILNTNSVTKDHPIYSLTYEDSLLSSPLLLTLYGRRQLTDQSLLGELKEYYYLCIDKCQINLSTTINNVPSEWCDDRESLTTLLELNIFQKEWIDQCWDNFIQNIQIATR